MISLCNRYVHESFMISPNYNSMLLRIQSLKVMLSQTNSAVIDSLRNDYFSFEMVFLAILMATLCTIDQFNWVVDSIWSSAQPQKPYASFFFSNRTLLLLNKHNQKITQVLRPLVMLYGHVDCWEANSFIDLLVSVCKTQREMGLCIFCMCPGNTFSSLWEEKKKLRIFFFS